MDRGVLDRMTPAFEHLLRNCVAHGIEDADTARRRGQGRRRHHPDHLHQEGNDVSVEFQRRRRRPEPGAHP
jgi:chemosensory pili system protein ChpA (sensor histidine kinase/response regulator)